MWFSNSCIDRFWKRVPESSTDIFRKRFIQTWEDYVTAVAVQAEARDQSHIPDLETFMQVRRQTSGAYSTIALCEIDLNIPDDIRRHPTIVEMEMLAVDLICIANVSKPHPYHHLLSQGHQGPVPKERGEFLIKKKRGRLRG